MPELAALGNAAFRTCAELLDMGASATDKKGIRWIPPEQMVREHEGSVALRPDPETLKQHNLKLKQEQKLAGKVAGPAAGPGKEPARVLNRMMNRPLVKGLMNRVYRDYTPLKQQPAFKTAPTPKQEVSAMSTRRMAINVLNAKREWLRPVARAGLKLATAMMPVEPTAKAVVDNALELLGSPKPRRSLAYNCG